MRYRYCIIRDSYNEPSGFRLTNEDIYGIASKCDMVLGDGFHQVPLVLERVEATALYCRDLIGIIDTDIRAENTGFLQLQLTANQCLLVLNRIPLHDGEKNGAEVGKSWNVIYKYAKCKRVPFNFMNITCQNLWTHIQKHHQKLLKKCRKHSSSKQFFHANNMKVFNELLLAYLSTAILEVMEGEKMHVISICREGDCCRVYIANMDLAQYGFIPSISRLVSEVQSSISNQHFHDGLYISNVFLLGRFLCCQSQKDYKFLEDILLTDLKKMSFTRSKYLKLQHRMNNTQIIKVEVESQIDGDKNDQNLVENIVLKGSFIYSIHSNNRLLERFSTKSIAIRTRLYDTYPFYDDTSDAVFIPNIFLTDAGDEIPEEVHDAIIKKENEASIQNEDDILYTYEIPHVTCNQSNSHTKTIISIIKEGAALAALGSIEEDVEAKFTVFNSSKHIYFCIELYMYKENIDIEWEYSPTVSFFEYVNPSYPIILKIRHSQTGPYKCWLEYDQNSRSISSIIKENVLLKSSYPSQYKPTLRC